MSFPLIKNERINREYSFLLFDRRVLDQAMDLTNPLLERAKFLSIFKSNLDEFTEVRMGSLENERKEKPGSRDPMTDLTPGEQLERIFSLYPQLYKAADQTFSFIREDLREKGLDITKPGRLTDLQRAEAEKYFRSYQLPRISPMVLGPKHPMMRMEHKRIYLLLLLERGGKEYFALASLNPRAERLFEFTMDKRRHVITSEDMLYAFADIAFPGFTVRDKSLFRITRNQDFTLKEGEADEAYDWDWSNLVMKKVSSRSEQEIVRLEMSEESPRLRDYLIRELDVSKDRVFITKTYFDYKFLFSISSLFPQNEREKLSFRPFEGYVEPSLRKGSIIREIEKRDVLLTYPYDSIEPLISLLEEASEDESVREIRITIYRLSQNSRICAALMKARENGKEVTALTELAARFDEENNLHYATLLLDAGCRVYYGHDELKVHSKIISIKREKDGIVSYITHIGTGNYNETTSTLYTDINLLTADDGIGRDGELFFRNLALMSQEGEYERLLVSPLYLRDGLMAELDREAGKGKDGLFRAKFNSLTDRRVIDHLIAASNKGCSVRLCVRGLCTLLPGVPGKTENIRITSVVGRFLEHSRIYAFGRNGDERIYIASADMMTRNLEKRVEIACPILDEGIKRKISLQLETVLCDNVKARELGSDGVYRKVPSLEKPLNSQEKMLRERETESKENQ